MVARYECFKHEAFGCRDNRANAFWWWARFFLESFSAERYKIEAGIDLPFVQDNHSRSSKVVLRGLHYQINKPQGKLVRVVRGEVLDVAVDIDPNSTTYGQYEAVLLSEENKKQF